MTLFKIIITIIMATTTVTIITVVIIIIMIIILTTIYVKIYVKICQNITEKLEKIFCFHNFGDAIAAQGVRKGVIKLWQIISKHKQAFIPTAI